MNGGGLLPEDLVVLIKLFDDTGQVLLDGGRLIYQRDQPLQRLHLVSHEGTLVTHVLKVLLEEGREQVRVYELPVPESFF